MPKLQASSTLEEVQSCLEPLIEKTAGNIVENLNKMPGADKLHKIMFHEASSQPMQTLNDENNEDHQNSIITHLVNDKLSTTLPIHSLTQIDSSTLKGFQDELRGIEKDKMSEIGGYPGMDCFVETCHKIRKSYKQSSNLALLAIDIDSYFETIDAYGEEVGNQVLKQISDTLAGVVNSVPNALFFHVERNRFLVLVFVLS